MVLFVFLSMIMVVSNVFVTVLCIKLHYAAVLVH